MLHTLLLVVCLTLSPAPAQSSTKPSFLRPPLGDIREVAPTGDVTVLRTRPTSIDFDRLRTIPPFADEAIALDLFDDVQLVPVFERFTHRSANRYTWLGSLRNDPDGWFVLVVENEALVANFWLGDGRAFEITPTPEGEPGHLIRELIVEKFAPCSTCRAQEVRSQPVEGGVADDGGIANCSSGPGDPTIDVLVVWTPAARIAQGGTNAITALVEAAVASSNTAYQNSNISARLRLVYVGETDYVESGSFSTDLSRLRNTNDGYMDEVHPLRNEYGADLVALISNGTGSCGIAYLMTNLSPNFASSAFSVTRRTCAVGNLTFAHELGHNMGCAHDHDNASNALFSYSYGHRWTTTGGQLRRSVMAYAPGTRVAHFSNPEVLNGGVPTGIPEGQPQAADNAKSINIAAPTVAAFRPSLCDPPANNTCANSEFVTSGVHVFSNVGATTNGPNEPASCNFSGDTNIQADVWFAYLSECTGSLTVSLCGSDFLTKLGIYFGLCPTSPDTVQICNVGGCEGQQAEITLPVNQNQSVRIRVGGHNGATGNGVLTISCVPPKPDCLPDLNNDGAVDVQDLLILLGAWGPCMACPGDLNFDGAVDVQDLLILLGSWGQCS
ncbi:MAG TPA: M12 family metallo-peptidase [Phycisphaerales bacterium]|nr:M12 family metallo-peptidase [Phycisphaerales bacterium]HRQ74567.1 M12 family metallo-peptidase [Phycisphaerales bacterium]